jgi:DNA transformation protein
MLALIADNELYLKTDERSVDRFDRLGLRPFRHTRGDGRTVTMSYRLAPESFFDDDDSAAAWTELAWQAALRAPGKTRRRQ